MKTYSICGEDGYIYKQPVFLDLEGNPVKRTKYDYPYSYDGFVQEIVGDKSEINADVWTDRLLEWDYKLTRKLIKKHFADTKIDVGGDYWGARSIKTIQKFLRERLKNPNIRVIAVMEYCNQSNGYPVWWIGYNTGEKKQK